jgi:hypothetical protein
VSTSPTPDGEELFRHEVTPWTVGQLRAALAGLPDDTPLQVNYAEEPGGKFVSTQVVIGAGFGSSTMNGVTTDDREFSIDCEFPSGEYYRRIR